MKLDVLIIGSNLVGLVKSSTKVSNCHAQTLSQARDNRRVNPSGVINIFLELAQGFQTPIHTYNP